MSFNPENTDTDLQDGSIGEEITEGDDFAETIQQRERAERIRREIAERAGEGYTPDDVSVTQQDNQFQGVLNIGAVRRQLSQDILANTDRFGESDVVFNREGGQIQAGFSEQARRREAAEQISSELGEDISQSDIELTETGARLSQEAQEREALEDLQGTTAIDLTGEDLVLEDGSVGLSEQAQQQERGIRIDQAIQEAAQDSERYSPGDFTVTTEDGQRQIVPTEAAISRERQEQRAQTIDELLSQPLSEDSSQSLGDVFSQEDVAFREREDGQVATLEDAAIQDFESQQRQESLEEAAQEFDRFSVPDLQIEGDQIVPTDDAISRERREQLESAAQDFERFSVADLEISDGTIQPTEQAIEREQSEARQDALESAATEFESFTVEDLEITRKDGERVVQPVSDAVQRERREQLEQVASESDRFSVADLEILDGQIQPSEDALAREREEIRADTFSRLQDSTDTDISQDDIEFTDSGVELSPEVRRQEAVDDLQSETDIDLTTADIALSGGGASITEAAQRREAAEEFGSGISPADIEIEDGQATVSDFAQERQAADDLTSQIRNQISREVFGEIGSGPNEFDLSTADIQRTESGFGLTESGREAVEQAQLDTAIDKLDAETPYNRVTRDDVNVTAGGVELTEETQLQVANTFRGDDALEMSEVRFSDDGIELTESAQLDRFREETGIDVTTEQADFDQGQLDIEETERALIAEDFEAQIREQGFDISGVSASDLEREDGQFVLGNAVQEQIEAARIEPTDVGTVSPIVADELQTGAVGLNTEFDVTTELTAEDRRTLAADTFNEQIDTDIRIDSTAVELTNQGAELRDSVVEGIQAEAQAEALQRQFELRDERVAAALSERTGLDLGPGAVDVEGDEVEISESAQRGIEIQEQVEELQAEFEAQQTRERLAETQGVDLSDELAAGTETSQRLARETEIEQAIAEESEIDQSRFDVARGELFLDQDLRQQVQLGELQDTQGVDATTEFGSGTLGGLGSATEAVEETQQEVSADLEGVSPGDVSVVQSPTGARVTATQTTTQETDSQPLGGDIVGDAVSLAEDTTGLDAPGDGPIMIPTEDAIIDDITGGLADQVSGADLRGGIEDVTGIDVPTQEDVSGGIDAFVEEPIEDATGVNIPSAEQFNRGVDRATANVVSGLEWAAPSRRETAALATTAVAVPEPASTGTGVLVLAGLTAATGAATLADEYNLVGFSQRTVQEEEEIPVTPQEQSELPVSDAVPESELSVSEGDVSELSVPESDQFSGELEPGETDVTELPIDPSVGSGELPISARTQQLIQRGRQEQEEDTREITDEDIVTDLPEPDQPGPSVREQQQREDLFAPRREFPTGEQAVIGRETVTEETTERVEQAQESDLVTEQGIPQTPEDTVPLAEDVDSDTLTQAQQERLEAAQGSELFANDVDLPGVTQPQQERIEQAQDAQVDVTTDPIQSQVQELRGDIGLRERGRTVQETGPDILSETIQDTGQFQTPTPTLAQQPRLDLRAEQIPRVTEQTEAATPTENPPANPTLTEFQYPEAYGTAVTTQTERRPRRRPDLEFGSLDSGESGDVDSDEQGILTDFLGPLTGERIETTPLFGGDDSDSGPSIPGLGEWP